MSYFTNEVWSLAMVICELASKHVCEDTSREETMQSIKDCDFTGILSLFTRRSSSSRKSSGHQVLMKVRDRKRNTALSIHLCAISLKKPNCFEAQSPK